MTRSRHHYFMLLGVLVVLLAAMAGGTAAQDPSPGRESEEGQEPFSIKISRAETDARGTDVTNIFEFEIGSTAADTAGGRYTIAFLLDGRVEFEVKNKALPWLFQRNLKGQKPGSHEIIVVIGDAEENILYSKAIRVTVRSPKRRGQ